MKLLIITQKVDQSDAVLGFFHRWIAEFRRATDGLTVIAQTVGDRDLPADVHVVSLGKDRGVSKSRQIMRFWAAIVRYRKNYDAVFVHMSAVWVILGFPVWFLCRKRVYLWYEARGTRWTLRLALLLVRRVFSASAYGMPIPTPKSVIMGHGIDTERYTPLPTPRDPQQVLTVGRVTRGKHLTLVMDAFAALPASAQLRVVGKSMTPEDEEFQEELNALIHQHGVSDRVTFQPLPPAAVVPLLQQASLFLHASMTGLDKALLEAMACGCPVVSCNPAAREFLPEECCAVKETFVTQAQELFSVSDAARAELSTKLRAIILQNHSLPSLVTRLVGLMAGG